MRTTLNLDRDIVDAARSLARQRGLSLGAAVSELARRGLAAVYGSDTSPAAAELPRFQVAEEAPPFGTEDVKRALDEDES